MFESIVNDYLESTPYKEWSIIAILQYTASKSELSRDTIDILKIDSYSVLQTVCRNVTSANTLQTLKEHCVAKIEIEDICNVDVNEVTVSTALKQKSHPSQSESRNKKTTIDLSDQSESGSGLYYEDSVERVQEEVYIFSAQRIETRVMNIELIKKNSFNNNEAEEFISKKEIKECWNGREIENDSQKQQHNFTKQENEHERLGDKHDGILYMNICGVKVGIGFIKVVGNAFATITSNKNDDLEKLLKGISHAHQSDENTSKLQSFAVLVYGCEFHFLSMHLIGDMYVVDKYDAFVIPDSGLNLLHIGDIVKIVKKFKIRMIKYYHKLIQKPCIVTWPSMSGLPTASPFKPK
nr:13115_t:CDS:2 [Entrophospora candida]